MLELRRVLVRMILPSLLLTLPLGVPAQTFETAAVHPSTVRDGCTNILPPGSGRFEMTCVPLRALVQFAYRADELEGPGSLDTMYDVRATIPNGASWTMDSVQPMLQALLAERFHLTFHTKPKSVAGFDLVVGSHGSRLKAAKVVERDLNHAPLQFVWAGRVKGVGLDSAGLASLLGLAKHAHIVDRTGLQGRFDIDMQFAPEDNSASDLPEFSTAVKEQLGLELKPASVPITVMIVDHVDAEPAAN